MRKYIISLMNRHIGLAKKEEIPSNDSGLEKISLEFAKANSWLKKSLMRNALQFIIYRYHNHSFNLMVTSIPAILSHAFAFHMELKTYVHFKYLQSISNHLLNDFFFLYSL